MEQPKKVENRLKRAVIDGVVVVWWLGFVRWRRAIKLSLKKRERKKNDK
jgi:hypothetical protein